MELVLWICYYLASREYTRHEAELREGLMSSVEEEPWHGIDSYVSKLKCVPSYLDEAVGHLAGLGISRDDRRNVKTANVHTSWMAELSTQSNMCCF
jgi:hypothetical protein